MMNIEQQKCVENYCYQAGIKYYDVQLELTDHITEWIENDMRSNGFSFDDSFVRMSNTFTKKDCRDIERSKAKSIRRKIMLDCSREFISYFSWPKITLLFLLMTVIAVCDQYMELEKIGSMYIHIFNMVIICSYYSKGKIIQSNREGKIKPLAGYKQAMRMQFLMNLPIIIYCLLALFLLSGNLYPVLVNKVLAYLFPVVILAGLSCKKVMIAVHQRIRKQYPIAFD